MSVEGVHIVSRCIVRPSTEAEELTIHLTPWDLQFIPLGYNQKGILLPKPNANSDSVERIIPKLRSSFSIALAHFFPLAGRLAFLKTPDAVCVILNCNNHGAEFVHAVVQGHVTASDVLASRCDPSLVELLFPLNGAMNYEGDSLPLLAVQVTELTDGSIFIGCPLNHSVADGTSFWHFMNSWSEVCGSSSNQRITCLPSLTRWFPDSCFPPIRLPFSDQKDLVKRPALPSPVEVCTFHFSAKSVANIKAKANSELSTNLISSLQALLAHVWRRVTRARRLEPHRETTFFLAVGTRARLEPPLPTTYMGSSVLPAGTMKVSAAQLSAQGLGGTAWMLNQVVTSQVDSKARDWLRSWIENPSFGNLGHFNPCDLIVGSSPRFDVYGNDFGWGRPIFVRSGNTNRFDGKMTVFEGPESGSISMEVYLSPQAMRNLVEDKEFMEAVADP